MAIKQKATWKREKKKKKKKKLIKIPRATTIITGVTFN